MGRTAGVAWVTAVEEVPVSDGVARFEIGLGLDTVTIPGGAA
jgi:hypothetical protein